MSDAERVKQIIEAIPSYEEPQMIGLAAHFPQIEYHGGAQYTVECNCGFKTKEPENYYVAKARWADHAMEQLAMSNES